MHILADLKQVINQLVEALGLKWPLLLQTGLQLVFIWLGAWVAWRVIRILARRIVDSSDDGDDTTLSMAEKRGQTIAHLLQSVGRVLLLAAAALMSLNLFIPIAPLLAGAGILGLAFSFGAQSLVKDIISGFFILFENQFGVGDIIETGGHAGVVEKMTMRIVVLRDVEGVVHTIPNGLITAVSNKTRSWSRAVIEVGVAYGEPIDRVLTIFRDEAAALSRDPTWRPQLDGDLEVWGVEDLADSAVVIRTVARTVPGAQWNVAREFRRRIKNRLDAEGVEIPFPQRTLHLRVDDDRLARALPRGGSAGSA